ncbi:MAG: hypothetical protein V5783_05800 [Pontiella sp.]
MTEVPEKPLGRITAILADLGLEVTYAYDDLVFVQECAFLIQFTDEPKTLKLFTNVECEPEVATDVEKQLITAHAEQGFSILPSGQFSLSENDNETINIKFT